jgi:hypothetical protein
MAQADSSSGNDDDVNEIVKQSDVYKALKKQGEIHDEKIEGECEKKRERVELVACSGGC